VTKAVTYLTTAAASQTGAAIHGTAAITNGSHPTGTVTFTLTGPDDMFCSGPPAFTSTVAVNGNGSYDSGLFAPTRSGEYTWRSIYSGDADNLGTAVTSCMNAGVKQTVSVVSQPDGYAATGRDQLSVFRPETGVWYIQDKVGGAVTQVTWGQAGDIPVPGDYNGDGRKDIAVYRPSNGLWLVQGMPAVSYGGPSYAPVPGDYNGDGRTDIAVFRPSTGYWYVLGISTTLWGYSTDVPVPGDYNGDGRTDIAVFRPSTGYWYVLGIVTAVLGSSTDIPVPGDYDGDGRTDPTVFRPSTGTFFLNQTTAGVATSALGIVGDVGTLLLGIVSSLV